MIEVEIKSSFMFDHQHLSLQDIILKKKKKKLSKLGVQWSEYVHSLLMTEINWNNEGVLLPPDKITSFD